MGTEVTERIVPPSRAPLRDGRGRIIANDADWAEWVERLIRHLEELDRLPDTAPPAWMPRLYGRSTRAGPIASNSKECIDVARLTIGSQEDAVSPEQATDSETIGLADEAGPIPAFPPREIDASGRLIPISGGERQARREAQLRAMRALGRLPDTDPPGVDAEVMRSIDEGRPHRPLFEGLS